MKTWRPQSFGGLEANNVKAVWLNATVFIAILGIIISFKILFCNMDKGVAYFFGEE